MKHLRNITLVAHGMLTGLILIAFSSVSRSQEGDTVSTGLNFTTLFNAAGNPEVACYRIPALITAPNGDLICAVDERIPSCRDLNGNRDINIVCRRSTDNGNTWSEITTVIDYPPGQSASDPSMIVDEMTETIFLFFNFMDLDSAAGIYRLMVLKSTDHGITWGAPEDITGQITKPEWETSFKFITSGRGIQTTTGRLLHTMVNLEHGLHLFASDDHGNSWYLLDNPVLPGDESKIVELEDGRWMINSRVNNYGTRYVHTSSDEGQSWLSGPDSSLTDPGCNASLLRYTLSREGSQTNLLLFSNVNATKERKNLTVRISHDDGQSWPVSTTIYPGSAAYSSMTVLTNGDVGLLFEKDAYREIVFIRLTMKRLTSGSK